MHKLYAPDGRRVVVQPVHRGQWADPMSLTAKVVCQGCNGGWMSALEGAAKPIITGLNADGSGPWTLSADESGVLAHWAAQTAALFQFNDPETRSISDADVRRLRDVVPASMAIWAFMIGVDSEHFLRLSHTGGPTRYLLGGPRPPYRIGSTLLCADRVSFVVHYSDFPDHPVDVLVPAPGVLGGAVRLWSPGPEVTTELPELDDGSVDRLANWLERQVRDGHLRPGA